MYKAIIPAAGLGTRLNMPHDKSKEMLPDPITGKPLIEYYLDICKTHNLPPIVITRAEKQDLISYLNHNNIEYIIIKPQGEWPNTVLSSFSHWTDKNFLFLPDTRFEGEKIVERMKNSIDLGAQSCFALHQVDDVSKWGTVDKYRLIEKSREVKPGMAWGIMAFNKGEGYRLMTGCSYRDRPIFLRDSSFVYLNKFVDITRNGVLERY